MHKRKRKKAPGFYSKQPVKHVVGFSGGIDSQACARWVLNHYPPKDVILLNSDAGGNEHPITMEFVRWYSDNIHPVVMLHPIVADMAGRKKERIEELGLSPNDPMSFELATKIKGMWPGFQFQWCTLHLKLCPQARWIKKNLTSKGVEWKMYSGVRREESKRRADKGFTGWDDFFGKELQHPIVDWTKKMCFDYVKYHGEEINKLYTLGFNRVGCAPCVNSNKQDIRKWAQRFPEMIDKIRGWEEEVGSSFFRYKNDDGSERYIDDVVKWSMTKHGGKVLDLEVLQERPSCESEYGICE